MTTNPQFDAQMKAFKRAWVAGTTEYEYRKTYPGDRVPPCGDDSCINSAHATTTPVNTYWLCDECSAAAPCPVTDFKTHSPWLKLPSKQKRQAFAAAVFTGYCLTQKHAAAAVSLPA